MTMQLQHHDPAMNIAWSVARHAVGSACGAPAVWPMAKQDACAPKCLYNISIWRFLYLFSSLYYIMCRKNHYLCSAKTKTDMRNRIITLFLTSLWALLPGAIHADSPIEDGVYSINCTKLSGWLGLGFNHDADPYIYYVTDGSDVGDDGWWTVTNTPQGYTFRNASTDELLVFTYDRADLYYKYMTLSRSSLGDDSEYWNIIQGADGAYSIQSVL